MALVPRVAAAVVAASAFVAPSSTAAQTAARETSLHVTVADQTGAVIPGARVTLQPLDPAGAAVAATTNEHGEAVFAALAPGRYAARGEFPGFEPRQVDDVRLRGGVVRRELRLPIARIAQDIEVGRDARDRGLDPRGDAFSNVLSRDQIESLPDDPDDMEAALKEMGGPGAVIRVDGFRGGKLPPKSQIRSIRFRRDTFAAENHGGGMVFVDITTNPGGGPLRGTADFTFRDESLNARNPFSPLRAPEQQQNYGFTLNGTLIRNRTSFAITSNGTNSYDSQTIFAAAPGGTIADAVRRPTDRSSVSARIDHALTRSQTLKASYQHGDSAIQNLGVGDFNLPSRAYTRNTGEDLFRASIAGPLGRKTFAETRFQARRQTASAVSLTDAPAVIVLDAFSSGGAQVSGGRTATELELASDLDYATGRHAARFGFLLESGFYRSDEVRNAGGTFTFGSLETFEAGRPSTFTQRTGAPLVTYGHAQLGWYAQDDIRLSKSLTLGLGLRHEMQTHMPDLLNLAPRASVTWSPFKSGVTTLRAGAGLFYDWYDPQTYEQTLRVDGTRQTDLAVLSPGYPDPFSGGSVIVLPGGRIVQSPDMQQPTTARMNAGVEQSIGKYARVNAMYGYARGRSLLRGHDVNAPGPDGLRPDPTMGTVTQVESTARSAAHVLHAGFSVNLPWHRTLLFANYTLGRSMNEADGPFSLPADNLDPGAEWGPSPNDARHRVAAMFTMNLWKGVKAAANYNGNSSLPYNITTGFDDNRDSVSNDRPPGIGRNTARGKGRSDLGARLSWSFGFGEKSGGAAGGTPTIMIRTIGGDAPMGGFGGGAEDRRWRFELYLAGTNLLNHTNPLAYSGVLMSPFFGHATSAAAPRKLELGVRFGF